MTMTYEEVSKVVQGERDYQNKLWSGPDHVHVPLEYLYYIRDYLQETFHLQSRFMATESAVTANVRKVAALAFAALEQAKELYRPVPQQRSIKNPQILMWYLGKMEESVHTGIRCELAFPGSGISELHQIVTLALTCMQVFGAPARDIEGDLAKRKTVLEPAAAPAAEQAE